MARRGGRISPGILLILLLACYQYSSATYFLGAILASSPPPPPKSDDRPRGAASSSSVASAPSTSGSSSRGGSTSPSVGGGGEPDARVRLPPLPPPNASAPPVSLGGCCGIGHRLCRNIPAAIYAISRSRPLVGSWPDVPWNAVFNDTALIKQGPPAEEHHHNGFPKNWDNSSLARYGYHPVDRRKYANSAYGPYGAASHRLFEMPLAHAVVASLADSLSPLVLSFLDPMREQYSRSDAHLCVHVREGNNETGHWRTHKRRHIELTPVLNATLDAMTRFAGEGEEGARRRRRVTLFAASDNELVRPWFEDRAPSTWRVVRPGRVLPRPHQGVWFGQIDSKTNRVLTEEERNEAMAEAVADVFALGECDALFVPNFSSFSVVGIALARAKRKKVFFLSGREYMEYP